MTGVRKDKPNDDQNKSDSNSKKIPVHIGLFFDGTSNSMMNVKERKAYDKMNIKINHREEYYKNNDSHANELSNVAAQYSMYLTTKEHYYSIYIEGIGTAPRPVDDEDELKITIQEFLKKGTYDDSTLAKSIGYGAYGVNGKIERGVEKIKSLLLKIKNKKNQEDIEFELTLDVFGFSRGAAAARSFSSRIKSPKGDTHKFTASEVAYALSVSSPYPGQVYTPSMYNDILYKKMEEESRYKVCLKDELDANGIKMAGDIKVNFLGLYDTVSSYGLSFSDDVKELALTIDNSIVEKVYQICAADEYRKNFSLTLVEPFDRNVIIPGAHSDIGGGYGVKEENAENFILYEKKHYPVRALLAMSSPLLWPLVGKVKSFVYAGNKTREELIDGGWYTEENVRAGKRYIKNTYQCISLNMMIKECGASKFAMKDVWKVVNKGIVYDFYKKLQSQTLYRFEGAPKKRKIRRVVPEVSQLEKDIRNQYLHLSSKGGENLAKILLSPESIGIGSDRLVHAPQPNNERVIFENK
ncbi:MAG: DUF2235 domain-containing protein [Paludibacteraceae bacterium]|nr:DUF2235 domain-containing protein [Paludibacteraceae bacterium]